MQLLHVTFGKSHSVAWLRPIYLIYNMLCWRNWLGLKIGKNKTNKQKKKKRLTSQTSGSNSRTESSRVALTIRNDGTISLRTAFRL